METKLAGASNLVLLDQERKEVVAVIKGKAGRHNITKQLEKAIKEHFVVTDVTIGDSRTVENQDPAFFTATLYMDNGEEAYNDFKLEVIATY